jgi:hypothetical protein
MANQPPRPVFSSISPGNLGVRAGYWSRDEADDVMFEPIIAWASILNYVEAGCWAFEALVLGPDHLYPTPAPFTREYKGKPHPFAGLFPLECTQTEAKARAKVWAADADKGADPRKPN